MPSPNSAYRRLTMPMTEVAAHRRAAAAACLLLVTALPCTARPAFFWGTTEGSFLSLENLEMQSSAFDLPTQGLTTSTGGSRADTSPGVSFRERSGESAGKRVTTRAQYDFKDPNAWVLGLGHEYSDLDLSDPVGPPDSNGHLHTLNLAAQGKIDLAEGELRVVVAPALSVSSNALKSPSALESDSVQLWGAALYSQRRGAIDYVFGAARDYRFGEARIYPVAGIAWRGDTLALRAVFPDVKLSWYPAPRWTLEFESSPDGNEWQAFNRELTDSTTFRREGWQSQVALKYSFGSGVEVVGLGGWHWQQRWRYVRESGAAVDVDGDDRAFFGVRIAWHFD